MNARKLYNGEYAVTDVFERPYIIKKSMWIVTAVDKRLSGWGMADGKICKRIVICDGLVQAHKVADNMRKDGFTYVGCRLVGRCGVPYYAPSKYVVRWHLAERCPVWNK